jgi:hypothetical protein
LSTRPAGVVLSAPDPCPLAPKPCKFRPNDGGFYAYEPKTLAEESVFFSSEALGC